MTKLRKKVVKRFITFVFLLTLTVTLIQSREEMKVRASDVNDKELQKDDGFLPEKEVNGSEDQTNNSGSDSEEANLKKRYEG